MSDDFIPPTSIPGTKPWLCEYDRPDGRYGIILHASDPAQLLEDYCEDLPGLTVLGEHGGTVLAQTPDTQNPAPERDGA